MNVEQIKSALAKEIAEDELNVKLHNIVREVLAKRDGQKITKRIETAVQQAVGEDVRVHLGHCGGPALYIWSGWTGVAYDNRLIISLGSENGCVCLAKFEDKDICHGQAAIDRIAKCQTANTETLRLEGICASVAAIREAKAHLDSLIKDLPYSIRRMVDAELK